MICQTGRTMHLFLNLQKARRKPLPINPPLATVLELLQIWRSKPQAASCLAFLFVSFRYLCWDSLCGPCWAATMDAWLLSRPSNRCVHNRCLPVSLKIQGLVGLSQVSRATNRKHQWSHPSACACSLVFVRIKDHQITSPNTSL